MSKFWSQRIKGLNPYVPGEQPKDKKYIKLNTNENPYPPSDRAIEAMRAAQFDDLKLYPDPDCIELRKTIADYFNVKVSNVFVGNGSDEVLGFGFMAFFDLKKPVLFPDITYSFYPVYCGLFGLEKKLIPLNDDFSIPVEGFKCENGGIAIPNPNAPTAKFLPLNDIRVILENNKDSVVIIDEAYVDFGGESSISLINEFDNLLVVQTLSKSRSFAGLRVGFAIGSEQLIQGLEIVKNSLNSYTLDRLALIGAKEAILDKKYFEETRAKIISTRGKVTKELKNLGFKVIESSANFVFITHEKYQAEQIFKDLKAKGILVRYFNLPRINNYLRVSIGTDEEMQTFINIMVEIL